MSKKKYVEVNDLLKHLPNEPYKGAIRRVLQQAHAADVVEIVRCKDCRHMTKELGYRSCNVWERINGHGDDGFCCYGERREQ